MKPLFVAGPGRSGTSAFTRYLNQHPEIMVCLERYKFIPTEVTPAHFAFDRILDYRKRETNLLEKHYVNLVSRKDPENLKWVGDKTPGYVRNFVPLLKNNPGARFVVMYRPIEEVAESYDARSKNPEDSWLGGKNGFELGVRDWNNAMNKTREFIESDLNPEVLVVSYHDFFYRNESFIPLISRFLDLEFGESVRRSWRKISLQHDERRRDKEPLSEEQARYIEENKNHAAEEWILSRMEKQWEGLEDAGDTPPRERPRTADDESLEQKLRRRLEARKQRIEELKGGLIEERGKTHRLEQQNRKLELKVRELEQRGQSTQAPMSRGLLGKLARLKDALSKRLR